MAFGDRPGQPYDDGTGNLHGAPRETCRLCGACDVGCQYGSKQTVDFTYLTAAVDAGAHVRTCCEAHAAGPRRRRLARALPPARGGAPAAIPSACSTRSPRPTARCSPTAWCSRAGTFGSTGLLLRNRAALPGLSPRLGRGFSGNGDLLLFLLDADRYLDPATGPVITASVRVPDAESPSGRGFLIQDAGAPAFSEWLWQGLEAPGDLWRALRRRSAAEAFGTARASAAMAPLLGMGRDVPGGRMELRGDRLVLTWRGQASRAYFEGLEATARRLGQALGGRVVRLGGRFARLLSVHPLGGCAMGAQRRAGRRGLLRPGLRLRAPVRLGRLDPAGPGGRQPEHDHRRPGRADRGGDAGMSALDWSESMSGRVSFDTTDYNQGWWQGTPCAFHLDLHVDDVERFFADDEHEATCTGWIDCDGLGERMEIAEGAFNLLVAAGGSRRREMRYRLLRPRSHRAPGDARGVQGGRGRLVSRHVGRHDHAVHAPVPRAGHARRGGRRHCRWPPASCTSRPAASWP